MAIFEILLLLKFPNIWTTLLKARMPKNNEQQGIGTNKHMVNMYRYMNWEFIFREFILVDYELFIQIASDFCVNDCETSSCQHRLDLYFCI